MPVTCIVYVCGRGGWQGVRQPEHCTELPGAWGSRSPVLRDKHSAFSGAAIGEGSRTGGNSVEPAVATACLGPY